MYIKIQKIAQVQGRDAKVALRRLVSTVFKAEITFTLIMVWNCYQEVLLQMNNLYVFQRYL